MSHRPGRKTWPREEQFEAFLNRILVPRGRLQELLELVANISFCIQGGAVDQWKYYAFFSFESSG